MGNGGMGVVVTTRPDAIALYFGHNNVWDIRIAENRPEACSNPRDDTDFSSCHFWLDILQGRQLVTCGADHPSNSAQNI